MINAVGLANPASPPCDAIIFHGSRTHSRERRKYRERRRLRRRGISRTSSRSLEEAMAGELAAALDGFELNVELPEYQGRRDGVRRRSGASGARSLRRRAAATHAPAVRQVLADAAGHRRAAQSRPMPGADGITVVNTIPGLVIDVDRRRPALGFGSGGVSGPASCPSACSRRGRSDAPSTLPVIGVGGVSLRRRPRCST